MTDPLSASPRPVKLTRRQLLVGLTSALGTTAIAGCQGMTSLADIGSVAGTVRIEDEFSPLRSAIVHDGSTARDVSIDDQRRIYPADLLAEHPETAASSRAKLLVQHEGFIKLLADAGVKLMSPVTQPGAARQMFARDPAFAIGRSFFVAQMSDPSRQPETLGLRELRQQLGNVVTFSSANALIEGGDVIVMDSKRVLVGTHRNTNEAGYQALSAALMPAGIECIRVPHRALHLDCCFAPLPDGTAMIAALKLPEATLAVLRRYYRELIALDADEASRHLACNVLWLDKRRVVSGVGAKKTNAMLRGRGFRVSELDFSQLVALWGGFRDVVCPLERSYA